jgi:hypothetical protein
VPCSLWSKTILCPTPLIDGSPKVFVNPMERGEIGPELFAAACKMQLEGLVSKRRRHHRMALRKKQRKALGVRGSSSAAGPPS